jgi:tRNA threonylcarbamoyladenosine biosynthesis protein TsaB
VALARGDDIVAAERRAMRHGHGEALLPMIAAAVGSIPPSEIAIVAVSLGPGGFTGIRVGLAAAQGIALAASARTIGVTSFAAVAAALTANSDPRALLVAIDSRRSDLYVQLFAASGEPFAEPAAVPPEDLPGYVAGLIGNAALLVAGDAAETAAAALAGRAGLDLAPGSAQDALGVLAAARPVWRGGGEPEPLSPLYLRPPDVSFPKPRPAQPSRLAGAR